MLKTLGNDGRKIVPLLSKRKRPSKKDRFKCFHNGIILIVICFNLDNTNIADIIHIKKIFYIFFLSLREMVRQEVVQVIVQHDV